MQGRRRRGGVDGDGAEEEGGLRPDVSIDEDGAEGEGGEVWREEVRVGNRITRDVMWEAQLPDGELICGWAEVV